MTNNDALQRFVFGQVPIRGEFVHLQTSFQEILQQHAYPEALRKLLGEALSAAALLSAIIKFEGRVTVQFRGKGKLKLLIAQCKNDFQIRGLAKWDGNLSYDDLMHSFNDGILSVMLNSTNGKQQSQGIVAWRGNSLAESLEGYFKESEQLDTKLWFAVNDISAAALLLQVLPSSDNKLTEIHQDILQSHWDRIVAHTITQLKSPAVLLHLDYISLLQMLYPEEEVRIFPPSLVHFKCNCSRERSEAAISLLSREEAEDELAKNQTLMVTCDFCNKEYSFDRVDVAKVFESNDKPPSDIYLH